MTGGRRSDVAIAEHAPTPWPGQDWAPLDAMFRAVIDDGRLSGAVVLAWQGGRPVHSTAIGWQDIAARTPMHADTLFRLYSMTKPVTAAAMLLLWDEGRWRPEDPISRFMPELADLKVIVSGDDDAGRADLEVVPTMEHLMTHQAGFSYGFTPEPVDRVFNAASVPITPGDLTAGEYLRRVATVPLAFQPGHGWRYSIAMDLQGIIVERLSGLSFRDFLQQRLFGPLGMSDTDFFVPADKRSRLATLYTIAGDVAAVMPPGPFSPPLDDLPVTASGGGGLVSTAADYLRFALMLHGGCELDGTRILSEDAVRLMRRSHTPAHLLDGSFGTPPHVLRPGYEYAYNGIVVSDPEAAGVPLGRGTYFWDGAAGCWFWSDPENDLVLVCLVQSLVPAEVLGLQVRSRRIVADIVADAA